MIFFECCKLVDKIKDEKNRLGLSDKFNTLAHNLKSFTFLRFLDESMNLSQTDFIGNICKEYQHIPQEVFAKDNLTKLSLIYDYAHLHALRIKLQAILTYTENLSLSQSTSDNDRGIYDVIKLCLKQRDKHINTILANFNSSIQLRTQYVELLKKYQSHFIPFCRFNDPLRMSSDNDGLGHVYRYAALVSSKKLNHLSIVSDEDIYRHQKSMWNIANFLKSIYQYLFARPQLNREEGLWHIFSTLNKHNLLILNYSCQFNSAITLRIVNDGIELYDSCFGLVQFKNRVDAANFLLDFSQEFKASFNFNKVQQRPHVNDVDYDVFENLPDTLSINHQALKDRYSTDEPIDKAITALKAYGQKLKLITHNEHARIKAHEIEGLIGTLRSKEPAELHQYVSNILTLKNHPLMRNRGTGLYFLTSGFKSHSQTETLLRAICHNSKLNIHQSTVVESSSRFFGCEKQHNREDNAAQSKLTPDLTSKFSGLNFFKQQEDVKYSCHQPDDHWSSMYKFICELPVRPV